MRVAHISVSPSPSSQIPAVTSCQDHPTSSASSSGCRQVCNNQQNFRQTVIQRSESWVSVWLTTVVYFMSMKSTVGCEDTVFLHMHAGTQTIMHGRTWTSCTGHHKILLDCILNVITFHPPALGTACRVQV